MKRNNAIALTLFTVIAIAILTGWCLWKVCYRCLQAKAYDIQMYKKSTYGSDVESGGSSKGPSKASSKVSEISEAKKVSSKKASEKTSEKKEESKRGSEKVASKAPTAAAWSDPGWGDAAPASKGSAKAPSGAGWGGAAASGGGGGGGGDKWGEAAEGAMPKNGW